MHASIFVIPASYCEANVLINIFVALYDQSKYLNFLIFGKIISMVTSSRASSFFSLDLHSKYSI